jgi:ABC-type nitrate/sulfonate/bicarbonate transport system substrate-binding protein
MERRTFLGAGLTAFAATKVAPARAADQGSIRIGYQSLWAPVGMIFEVLRNTNALALNGLDGSFSTFTQGGPLAEALAGRAVDTLSGGDVPVLLGTARRPGTKVVMRCIDWRWAVVVQPDFKGTQLTDLRGRKLGGSFVAGSFVGAMLATQRAGIANPERELQLINLDVAEIASAIQQKLIDAAVVWDPTLERLIATGAGKVLYMSQPNQALGWQSLSDRFLTAYGADGAVRFLKSWMMATWWASNHSEQALAWFNRTSRIDLPILKAAQSSDRYLRAPVADIKGMDLTISADDVSYSQTVVDFLRERKLANQTVDVASLVDMSFAEKAAAEVRRGEHPALADLKVTA